MERSGNFYKAIRLGYILISILIGCMEYKKSQTGLARSVYETICAFLNRRGGHVVLGADDDGTIIGIAPEMVQEELDTLAKDMNNPQIMNPTFYLCFEPMMIDGKHIIYFYVPESSQAHCHKGVYYDRNQDGDFALKNAQQIADLILRKQTGCTENRVLPYLTMDDLELELFDDVRKRVRLNRENHLWSTMTNEEILESAGMRLKDPSTGKEGYTLAAALLFGKERTLTSVVPFYRIDALYREDYSRLYDDREIIHCNLLRAYERLMEFCRKHLPEWPYIEGTQRLSIRELVMRENCLNLLIHREYGARHEASLTILKDRVETRNWNIPFGYGQITLDNLRLHAKNPTIANFFAQLGIVEELGNGMRTMFKYVPMISGGSYPMINEEDEFTVCIPFVSDKTTNKPPTNHQQTTNKTTHKPPTNHLQQIVLGVLDSGEKGIVELMEACGYKDKRSFRKSVINELISNKMIAMTHPENPNHRNQRYVKL